MASSFVSIEVTKDSSGKVVKFNIEGTDIASISPEDEETIKTDIATLKDALNITSENGIIQVKTTAEWNADIHATAPKGAIIVYSDYKQITVGGKQVDIAGIKISSSDSAYIIDMPFITDYIDKQITDHLADNIRHITAEERAFWNNKLNLELSEETLTFNRN